MKILRTLPLIYPHNISSYAEVDSSNPAMLTTHKLLIRKGKFSEQVDQIVPDFPWVYRLLMGFVRRTETN